MDAIRLLTPKATKPLGVTSRAAEALRAALAADSGKYQGVRLRIVGGHGCCQTERYALELAESLEKDERTVSVQGIPFFLSGGDGEALAGASIDYEVMPSGQGFRIRSEDRNHVCGCDH